VVVLQNRFDHAGENVLCMFNRAHVCRTNDRYT
jgi:hypothetical protein